MSLLTDREIKDIEMYARSVTEWNLQFARAIEAAVIRKLATVNVEPVAFHAQDGIVSVASHIDKDKFLFTIEALAAARVQAIEEAASRVKEFNHPLVNLTIDGRARLATEIRALIT